MRPFFRDCSCPKIFRYVSDNNVRQLKQLKNRKEKLGESAGTVEFILMKEIDP